jgi:hypothetical protein
MRYVDHITAEDAGAHISNQERTIWIGAAIMLVFIVASGGVFMFIEDDWIFIEGVFLLCKLRL